MDRLLGHKIVHAMSLMLNIGLVKRLIVAEISKESFTGWEMAGGGLQVRAEEWSLDV